MSLVVGRPRTGCHFYENLLPVKRESFDLVVNAAGIPSFYPSVGGVAQTLP